MQLECDLLLGIAAEVGHCEHTPLLPGEVFQRLADRDLALLQLGGPEGIDALLALVPVAGVVVFHRVERSAFALEAAPARTDLIDGAVTRDTEQPA